MVGLFACGSEVAREPEPADGGVGDVDAGPGWACLDVGSECRSNENMCCHGFCLPAVEGPQRFVCSLTCVRDDDCESRRCELLEPDRIGVCAPQ